MSLTRCRYCKHGNPADSRFCSACGGALYLPPYLASCPRCGTVNPVKATVCSWCQGQLLGTPVPSSLAEVSRFLRRRPSRVVVGTAVFAVIALLGYLTYRESSPADAREAPAASSDGGGVPPDAGSLDAAAATARAAANEPRADRQPVESQEAKAAAAARPQTVKAGKGRERGQSRVEVCTEAAAALGLCTAKPVPTKETTDARTAGGQEPPGAQACTEALAALGLCAPKPTQRRE
jgi:hypothetical protein